MAGMRSTPSRRAGFALVAGVCAALAAGSTLRVEVWDAEQLALRDRNSRCGAMTPGAPPPSARSP
jgi:hypothetical protein